MRRLWGILLAALISTGAHAQTTARVGYAADGNGSQPFTYVSSGTPLPVSGSFSAGSFAPGGSFANLTSTASSADAALPTGTTVALFNTGTTAVSCTLTVGAGSSTANKNIIQASSWFAVSVGSNTHYSCINQAGDGASNVVVASGGSGLPAGAGGGGGSGGAITCAACATSANQATEITALQAIQTNTGAAVPSGTNLIGNVGTITPAGATAITASATGTTAATTATLAGTSGKTTYMCWMSIRANATAAATGNATVTGTITGTLNFTQWTAPLASGVGVVEEIFNPCVPASGTNTGIAIISAAPGSGGTVSVSGGGYQL